MNEVNLLRTPTVSIYYPDNSSQVDKTSKWSSLRNTIHFIRWVNSELCRRIFQAETWTFYLKYGTFPLVQFPVKLHVSHYKTFHSVLAVIQKLQLILLQSFPPPWSVPLHRNWNIWPTSHFIQPPLQWKQSAIHSRTTSTGQATAKHGAAVQDNLYFAWGRNSHFEKTISTDSTSR